MVRGGSWSKGPSAKSGLALSAAAGHTADAGLQGAPAGRLFAHSLPLPATSPREGGAGTRRMRPRPLADACVAAGRTLKSPGGALGILAELKRRRAGGERGGLKLA